MSECQQSCSDSKNLWHKLLMSNMVVSVRRAMRPMHDNNNNVDDDDDDCRYYNDICPTHVEFASGVTHSTYPAHISLLSFIILAVAAASADGLSYRAQNFNAIQFVLWIRSLLACFFLLQTTQRINIHLLKWQRYLESHTDAKFCPAAHHLIEFLKYIEIIYVNNFLVGNSFLH